MAVAGISGGASNEDGSLWQVQFTVTGIYKVHESVLIHRTLN